MLFRSKYNLFYLEPGDRVEVNETDGIHYTEAGHRKMAELMEERIRKILE